MGKGNKKDKKKGKKIAKQPTYTKKEGVVDFLDETDMLSSEKYGCIMFASPNETMINTFIDQISLELSVSKEIVYDVVRSYTKKEHPKRAFKYVGGRSTIEDCAKRIKQIQTEESSFHIYTTENGKWCTFDPSPELIDDENYREEQLNEIIKGTKMAEERTKDFFRSEMRKKVEKARLEGTKEGQQILLEAEEPFQAVQYRAENADKSIQELREKIAEMERTKDLALRKMEIYREQGKDVVDPTHETEKKLENIRNNVQVNDNNITKEQLSRLKDIEKQAVITDATSKDMIQHATTLEHELFDKKPIIPVPPKDKEEEE